MAHIVKCRVCKKPIDTDTETNWIKPVERMYYHKDCYEDFAKKKAAVGKADLSVEADNEFWQSAVYDYLTRDVKMRLNFVKMKRQWDMFLKKGYTAKGIYFTLRYFYEVTHGDPAKAEEGIGIVGFIYKEGTEYWGNRNKVDRGICDNIEAQIREYQERERITVRRKEKYVPQVKVYSFEDIEGSEDE